MDRAFFKREEIFFEFIESAASIGSFFWQNGSHALDLRAQIHYVYYSGPPRAKTAALPGFCKIEYGGSFSNTEAQTVVVWLSCLPKTLWRPCYSL